MDQLGLDRNDPGYQPTRLLVRMDSSVNKLLHAPTTRLKIAASQEDGADLVRAAVHLFDLPEGPPPEIEKAPRDSPQGADDAHADDDDRLH